jgi:hypothetical protein
MTVITPQKGQSVPAAGTPGTIPVTCLPPVLAAHRACCLAGGYIEKGNLPAARRKLVQALASINQAGGAQ